jgi:hypothetical protein
VIWTLPSTTRRCTACAIGSGLGGASGPEMCRSTPGRSPIYARPARAQVAVKTASPRSGAAPWRRVLTPRARADNTVSANGGSRRMRHSPVTRGRHRGAARCVVMVLLFGGLYEPLQAVVRGSPLAAAQAEPYRPQRRTWRERVFDPYARRAATRSGSAPRGRARRGLTCHGKLRADGCRAPTRGLFLTGTRRSIPTRYATNGSPREAAGVPPEEPRTMLIALNRTLRSGSR